MAECSGGGQVKIAGVLRRRWVTVNTGLPGCLRFRSLAVLLLGAAAVLMWAVASKPVLLHTHILARTDDQSCGTYNQEGTGTAMWNPFRSRLPERTGDIFLRAVSKAECSPGLSAGLCRFVTERPLPASEWWLVNRVEWNSGRDIRLFYRLRGVSQEIVRKYNGCAIAHVDLARSGATWRVSGYGVTPGPYNGR
jgi:hypothetical protein